MFFNPASSAKSIFPTWESLLWSMAVTFPTWAGVISILYSVTLGGLPFINVGQRQQPAQTLIENPHN
jgi:hypothetical protein